MAATKKQGAKKANKRTATGAEESEGLVLVRERELESLLHTADGLVDELEAVRRDTSSDGQMSGATLRLVAAGLLCRLRGMAGTLNDARRGRLSTPLADDFSF